MVITLPRFQCFGKYPSREAAVENVGQQLGTKSMRSGPGDLPFRSLENGEYICLVGLAIKLVLGFVVDKAVCIPDGDVLFRLHRVLQTVAII